MYVLKDINNRFQKFKGVCTDLFYEEGMTVFIISIIEGKSFALMLFTASASSLEFLLGSGLSRKD